jgi:hypothetical protein
MENPTIKIRELKRRDRVVLAAMIRKMVDKIGDQKILNLMVSDSSQEKTKEVNDPPKDQFSIIGIKIIKLLLETLEQDVSAWFADLLSVTIEQLDDMPLDVELQVIDQIISAPEANRFFTSASQLFSKTRGLARRLQEPKKE